MALYEMEVTETRTIKVLYRVEAKNEDQARELAEIGETVSEESFSASEEVIDRTVYKGPTPV